MPAELELPLKQLLSKAGIDADIIACTPAARSGNNRIFRLQTTAGNFAVKHYFRHGGDRRDRLASEYEFLRYAVKAAPAYVPKPFGCDPERGLALYEFIEGLPVSETGAADVDEAGRFFGALNQADSRPLARNLPNASEACFSVEDHVELVDGRVARLLAEASGRAAVDRAAAAFLPKLGAFWQAIKERVQAAAEAENQWRRLLAPDQRCVSPSDFGFHNALKTAGGALKFIDFEYAGVDDPAKMIGDFFAQLAVPVPVHFFDGFAGQCLRSFPDPNLLRARARWLRPVYKLKWCCIALNVFLPEALARRRFADPEINETVLKERQLAKAQRILTTLKQDAFDGIH